MQNTPDVLEPEELDPQATTTYCVLSHDFELHDLYIELKAEAGERADTFGNVDRVIDALYWLSRAAPFESFKGEGGWVRFGPTEIYLPEGPASFDADKARLIFDRFKIVSREWDGYRSAA